MKNTEKDNLIGALSIFGVAVLLIGAIFLGGWGYKEITELAPKKQIQLVYDINDPYSKNKVREYLVELHVKYPDVAIAQMDLESGNGTSKIFRQGNNLFGMKLPAMRPTTALGERDNHAYYSHWRQSCIDYALFQSFSMNAENIISQEAWLYYIGKFYAEDDSYRQKLIAKLKISKKQ